MVFCQLSKTEGSYFCVAADRMNFAEAQISWLSWSSRTAHFSVIHKQYHAGKHWQVLSGQHKLWWLYTGISVHRKGSAASSKWKAYFRGRWIFNCCARLMKKKIVLGYELDKHILWSRVTELLFNWRCLWQNNMTTHQPTVKWTDRITHGKSQTTDHKILGFVI